MKNGEVVGEEYVGHNVAWVAVAVRCHTVVRGVHLAARLREEVCSQAIKVFVSPNSSLYFRVMLIKTKSKILTQSEPGWSISNHLVDLRDLPPQGLLS